ncbi:hypothetical protein [Chitinilyticum litopenaei]|uniref:hypothetical protein n=1 Tax=Chitinilyticum litopenaei TaxID=1121276 RepID=UPI00041885D9|nr:hypothetical protein [Chitinilyticum litopenaei]
MAGCREVTRDLTLAAEVPLGRYRRLQIGLHMLMCSHCRRHKAQLEQLQRLLQQTGETGNPDETQTRLDAAARARIARRLQEKAGEPDQS